MEQVSLWEKGREQEAPFPERESQGKVGRHERFRVGDRMVPADMSKLQAVHKLTVKSHWINLEVEFIVERLAPEARPVAMRVNDCRQRRMDRSVLVDVHVVIDDFQSLDSRVDIGLERLEGRDDPGVLLAHAPDSLPPSGGEVGFAGENREARPRARVLPVKTHHLVGEILEGGSPVRQDIAKD